MTGKSLVIRAYNEEKYIGRLLEGILQQTLADVEIILVEPPYAALFGKNIPQKNPPRSVRPIQYNDPIEKL